MGYPMARNLSAPDTKSPSGPTLPPRPPNWPKPKKPDSAPPPRKSRNADIIFVCVGDTRMATDVILGADGIIAGTHSGAVVVDCSTISVSQSRQIGQALKAKGVDFLDAPVTGSTPGAESGNLTFMIGGDAVFDRIRPLLDPMGKTIYYCGASGMGLQAKLTQNLILANIMMAFDEGMVLATKGGIDPNLMLEILDNSAAKSGLISYKAPFVLATLPPTLVPNGCIRTSASCWRRAGTRRSAAFDRPDPAAFPDCHSAAMGTKISAP